jgi:hypothetical protein
MASVIARFRVNTVEPQTWGTHVALTALYSPEDVEDSDTLAEIRSFHAATPNGRLTMSIRNEAAEKQFQVGDEFYLRLEKIPTHKTVQAIYAAKAEAARSGDA